MWARIVFLRLVFGIRTSTDPAGAHRLTIPWRWRAMHERVLDGVIADARRDGTFVEVVRSGDETRVTGPGGTVFVRVLPESRRAG